MAFTWKPRSQKIYLPKQGALRDRINQSYRAVYGTSTGIIGASQFEAPTSTVFAQGGRAGIQGGDFLSEYLLPGPARALEAPLRPFDALAGGGISNAIDNITRRAREFPGTSQAMGALDVGMGILDASNKASRAFLNHEVAEKLVQASQLNPNAMFDIGGGKQQRVGEFLQDIASRWQKNEFTGEQYTLEQLIERARQDSWNFGEFATSSNGIVSAIQQMVADPLNLAFFGAGAAVRGGAAAIRTAASWARPVATLGGRAPYMPRLGAGALQRLRGAGNIAATPFARGTEYLAKFGDTGVGPATLGNIVDLGRRIYFPAYGKMTAPRLSQLSAQELAAGARVGLGMGKTRAAIAAWELGGATQMVAGSGIEFGLGFLSEREYDEATGVATTEPAGWVDELHDVFHAINNSHPLSDSQTFTVLALFSPWPSAINAAWKRGQHNPGAYYNKGVTAASRHEEFIASRGAKFASEKEFLTELGKGDYDRGLAIWEAYVDEIDMNLVRNQFSDFTNEALTTIESKAQRSAFLTGEIADVVARRRASGALQGRSLADNALRFYKEGFSSNPETRLVRGPRTVTWDGFVNALNERYEASLHAANNGFRHMESLIIMDGAPITREILGGILNRLNRLDPDALVPRDVAAMIIERNPALIYEGEFWREFSMTLGQMLDDTGKTVGREALPTEGITVGQLRTHVEELIDTAPAERELYHEAFKLEERTRMTPGRASKVLSSAIPDDSPRALQSMRKKFITIGEHSETIRNKVRAIRDAEFFKNGKPKFESAKVLKDRFGNPFHRQNKNTFVKQAPKYELRRVRKATRDMTPDELWELEQGRLPNDTPDDFPDGHPMRDDVDNVKLEFIDRDRATNEFVAKEAYEATIGDKDVYIFKPDEATGYYANRAMPRNKRKIRPKKVNTWSDRDKFHLERDRWYVARKDGNGTLLTNQSFDTPKQAAEYTHSVSDQHVTVKIEDLVIDIDGRILQPRRGGVPGSDMMAGAIDQSYAHMEGEILAGVRQEWSGTGKKRKPHTIVHEDAMPMTSKYTRGDRAYYFIGDDGLPHGMLRIEFDPDGVPANLNVFVDRAYRGRKPYGRAFDMMYDRAFADGIDLSKVSGTSTTTAGGRATQRYWSTRTDTIDTGGLELALLNGGRIIEVDVMPQITIQNMPRSKVLSDRGAGAAEYLDYKTKFNLPDDIPHQIQVWTYKDGREAVIYSVFDKNGMYSHIEVRRSDLKGNIDLLELNDWDEAHLALAEEELLTAGGVQHAETLARYGFEEVARRGETFAPRIFRETEYTSSSTIPSNPGYLYHIRPVSSLARVKKRGIPPGISRPGEAAGVYFGDDVGSALSLAPPEMAANGMLLRVKQDALPDALIGRFDEMVHPSAVPADIIEYLGTDDQWHRLDSTEKATFAYRGGDPTKAALNSRINGANLPYKPSKRRVKTREAALNLARKRVNDSSVVYNSLDTLGPGYTNGRKFFSADERRRQLNDMIKYHDEAAMSAAESVESIHDSLKLVSGLDKVTDINHWFDQASPAEINKMVENVKSLNENWPSLQVGDGGIFVDPRHDRIGHLLTGYSTGWRHLVDYGFLSPISRFYDSLFTKKHSRALQREVYDELMTHTALVGMTPKQTEKFLDGVRKRVSESRAASGLGSLVGLHEKRNIRALDESQLRSIVQEAAGQEVLDRIIGRYGHVQKMVGEAANGLLRRSARRARHGGKVGKLEAAMNAAWRHYQYDPVLEHVSNVTHWGSKFFYPLLRFRADPIFAAMNAVEPYIYGITRHGYQKMRHKRTQFQQGINRRAVDRASRHSIPAGGFAAVDELPIETLLTDAGMYTIPRNMRSSIEAEHQIGRLKSYKEMLGDIRDNDPLARVFQERFGTMDRNQWVKEMDDIVYGWMNDGPEEVVRNGFREMKELHGWTDDEMLQIAPFMNRLSEMHRRLYDDIADLYIGRLNRTGIERVFDNFWLMWPLSYQIKATKWLASIMFQRIGGVQTGALGAYMFEEYRERFLRSIEGDEDMQAWLEENRDFIFLLEMMLPMSPESIGISLNKAVRITSSWLNANTINSDEIRDAIGDYSYVESVPEMAENTLRFGPFRTWNLFKRLLNQIEVPGWTYGNSGGNSLDEYKPSR